MPIFGKSKKGKIREKYATKYRTKEAAERAAEKARRLGFKAKVRKTGSYWTILD